VKSLFRLLALVLTLSLAGMPQLAVAQTIEELSQQGDAAQKAENYSQAVDDEPDGQCADGQCADRQCADRVDDLSHGACNYIRSKPIRRRVIKIDPKDATDYNNLGNVLSAEGKLEEAIAAYRQAIEIDPKDANPYIGMGNVLTEQRKLKEAIAAYRQAIKINPKNVDAYNGLGVALSDQGKQEEAIAMYRQVIEIDPRYSYAYNNMGNALGKQGKLEEAIAAYRQAIDIDPKFAGAYNGLGNALYNQGKLEEAIAAYRQAIEIDRNAYAYNDLGIALRNQGKLEEAIAAYRQAIEINPRYSYAYNNLGNALSDQEKLEEAIAAYRQAIDIDRKYAYAYNNLGVALSNYGKLEEAIAAYRQALNLPDDKSVAPASTHTLAHNNLGEALQQQDKLEQAIEEYKKALQISPNFVYGSNNLKEAERLLTLRRNPQAEVMDDRQYLPKNEPSFPIFRPVVLIKAYFPNNRQRPGNEIGAGLVIQRDGNRTLILTCRHVIFDKDTRKQGQNIQVEFFSKPPSDKLTMRRNARVLAMTPANDDLDIAVLKVTGPLPDDIKPLPISSNSLQYEMAVKAIGHPVTDHPWSIQQGTISNYDDQELHIYGPTIRPGSSGGPLLNSENQILGIVVTKQGNLGFAYPMPVIMEKLRQLGIK
jgi:tetratricopeptide (TPR) repeat protein